MNAAAILNELQQLGVTVVADGDELVLRPRRALDDELLARVREAKPAILEALRGQPATCVASCYEVEPSHWIRGPWAECTTTVGVKAEPRQIEMTCWHCRGEGKCGCSACWQSGPAECATCKGTGRVPSWIQ